MSDASLLREEELCAWLVRRAAQELKVDEGEVDPHARIMALGIDSLALIGLAGELAEFLDRDLRAELMWEQDSIAALARHLADAPVETEIKHESGSHVSPQSTVDSLLRVIRPGAGTTPAVSVGFLNIAVTLDEALPAEVPVCWLELPGLYRPPFEVRPVATMAADFADELTARFPTGPLTLVGFSFGGLVAFELACRLSDTGRDVRLMLLEPAWFGPRRPESGTNKLQRHLRALGSIGWRERGRYAWQKCQDFYDRVSFRFLHRRIETRTTSGGELPTRYRWKYFESKIRESLRDYVPGRFNGSACLVGQPAWLQNNVERWQRLLEQKPIVIPLEDVTDHLAVAGHPAAGVWLEVVKNWPANAQESQPVAR